jgi:phosphoribosylamine--glycine ligase
MPLLEGDLAGLMLACAHGRLAQAPPLTIRPLCSACVVAAAPGYPDAPRLGDELHDRGDDGDDRRLFHAGTRREEDGLLRTSGGRVLAAVAEAADFDAAFAAAYARLALVSFAGMQVRRDIGHQVRRS